MGVYEATTAGLTKIEPIPFEYEYEMRDFVADNIGVLFPGLEKVKNEMAVDDYRFDTVAYDSNQKTFVVIEYKNKKAKDAMIQAMAYATTIRNNRSDLILVHEDKPNDYKYDWDAVYSIIIAPSFDKVAKVAAQGRDDLELYTIKKYGNHIVAVERVGGGHERSEIPVTITHKQPDTPVTITREPPNTPPMINISEWKVQSGAKPTHMKFPDQPAIEVKSWTAVHAKSIEWLIDNGKISADKQITTKSGRVLYAPDEEYTRKLPKPKKTRFGWFDCNRTTKNHIDDITKIFEHAGVDMDFKIAIRPNEA